LFIDFDIEVLHLVLPYLSNKKLTQIVSA